MNLYYSIFRSEQIYTINDLAQIGLHNKREKNAYQSNPDIKLELTKNNIELVPLTEKYVKGFYKLTKDYKKEHDERMKTEREDRKKTFKQMLDRSNNVIADELMFTATNEFFKDMTRDDIKKWADTCMEFVYKDLVTQEVKEYYDYGDFQQEDIIDIAKGTTKEDELFDYAYVPDYHKTTDKYDEFEINL